MTFSSLKFYIFIYYTEISNLLTLVSSLIAIIYLTFGFKKGDISFPAWLRCLRFLSVTMLLMTMLITVFVLVPYNPHMLNSLLFSGYGLYHHTLMPIITIVSYIFLEPHYNKKKSLFIPLFATLLYGGIILVFNILRYMSGPYPFFKVYEQPVWASVLWFTGLPLLVVGFAALIYFAACGWDKIRHKQFKIG